jgi:hypothetical protein
MTQANGILEQFNMACNYAKHAGPNTRTVLLLDEVIALLCHLLVCLRAQSTIAFDLAGKVFKCMCHAATKIATATLLRGVSWLLRSLLMLFRQRFSCLFLIRLVWQSIHQICHSRSFTAFWLTPPSPSSAFQTGEELFYSSLGKGRNFKW